MAGKQEVVKDTLNYIEEHLEKKLTLDEIANRVGYSKFHLSRMFADEVGSTIHKYIQKRRLTEAAKKLVESEQPIAEIAFDANYESQQAFTIAFRQLYLCTPQLYRKKKTFLPKQEKYMLHGQLYKHSTLGCSVVSIHQGGIAA